MSIQTSINFFQSLSLLRPPAARVALNAGVQTNDVVEPKARDVEYLSSAHNRVNGLHVFEVCFGLVYVAPVNDWVPVGGVFGIRYNT